MGRLALAASERLATLMRARTAAAAVATVIALLSAACTTPVTPTAVAKVTVLPAADSLEVGSTISTFVATALDVNSKELTGRKVTWRMVNTDIATVDAQGQVTGVKVGSTRLVASIEGQLSAQVVVNVISKVSRIVVAPDSLEINLGTQKNLNGAVFDASGSPIPGRTITWSSANPLIAVVSANGAVSAIAVGETTVNAVVGTLSVTIKVRVIPEKVAQVRIVDPLTGSYILRLSSTVQLAAQALNGQNQPLTGRSYKWTSSNPAVASVSTTGLVTGNGLGTANIVVEVEGFVDQIQIQVTQVPVSTVSILPTSLALFTAQTAQLAVIAKDSAGNALSTLGRNVVWLSSNNTVASVSAGGVVSAVSAGTANVQVVVDQVPSGSIAVTVNDRPTVSVQVSPQTQTLRVGLSLQLQAVPRDINGNVLGSRPTVWATSDPSLATVSANGLVLAIAAGQVRITATIEGIVGDANLTIQSTLVSVATVSITPTSLSLLTTDNAQLTAIAKDSAGNVISTFGRNVTWLSSNHTVATVNGVGVVNAVGAGTADIQVVVDQVPSATITVTVTLPPVVSVQVSPQTQQLKVGFTFQLQAVPRDINGNTLGNRPTTWTSANTALATVSANGLVQALAVGTVKITATIEGVSGDAIITVIP